MQANNQKSMLKVAMHGRYESDFSPENISTIALYHIKSNIWASILSEDRTAGVAKLLEISPDQLTYSFEIVPGSKFSNGRPIESEDVKFSIDRIVSKGMNGHINAKGIVTSTKIITPSKFEIKINAPTPSFVFLLGTPEFAVIPKEACDPKNLAIVNKSVTSGAYTVSAEDSDAQTITLKKNSLFRFHDPDSPEQVLIGFDLDSELDIAKLKSKGIDLFEVNSSKAHDLVKLVKEENGDLKTVVSRPGLSAFFIRNPKGISVERARAFSAAMKKNLQFETTTEHKSFQFLPPKTFGALEESELPNLGEPNDIGTITVRVSNTKTPLFSAIQDAAKRSNIELKFVGMDYEGPYSFDVNNQGMNIDFPEIEFYLSMLSPYAWIPAAAGIKELAERAFHETDANARATLIKQIGKTMLETGTIVPVTVRASVQVYNSATVDASTVQTYDGDISFWKLRML